MPFLLLGDADYSCLVEQLSFDCQGSSWTYLGGIASESEVDWFGESSAPDYVCTVASGTSVCTTDSAWPDYICTNFGSFANCDTPTDLWADYTCDFIDQSTTTCVPSNLLFPEFTCVFEGTFSSGSITCFNVPSTSCSSLNPIAIPDNDPIGISSSVSTALADTIADLDICVNIHHDWVGDLVVTLTHEDTGTSVVVVDRPGVPALGEFGCFGVDMAVYLDDEAASDVEDECSAGIPTINGNFRPNNPLSAFDGESIQGTWTVTVSDNEELLTGSLSGWTIWYGSSVSRSSGTGPRSLSALEAARPLE